MNSIFFYDICYNYIYTMRLFGLCEQMMLVLTQPYIFLFTEFLCSVLNVFNWNTNNYSIPSDLLTSRINEISIFLFLQLYYIFSTLIHIKMYDIIIPSRLFHIQCIIYYSLWSFLVAWYLYCFVVFILWK